MDALARLEAAGAARRDDAPLDSLADVPDAADRPDPIAILQRQDEHRLQSLVPIRHARMQATAFTFYRGAAAIMADDLSKVPTPGLRVQLCGDAHLSNMGVFNSPDRRLVFDVNDFDETLPGPFDWDLKRLAASVSVAGRNNELTDKQIDSATRAAAKAYRKTIAETAQMSPLDLHYFRIEIEAVVDHLDEKLRKRTRKPIEKATRKDSVRALEKLTEVVDGQRRIISDPPLIVRLEDAVDEPDPERTRELFERYRSTLAPHRAAVIDGYHVVDAARKVVGVGSVGTRCWIVLLESVLGAPLFLQFKEATASVLEPYLGASEFAESGERVVRGQRLMQSTGDVLLGWSRYGGAPGPTADFYFRQLWDGKGSAEVEEMGPKRLKQYADHCGSTLAIAHARTGDAAAIAGYLGDDATADHALAAFGSAYADLNEADHAAHGAAIAAGRLPS